MDAIASRITSLTIIYSTVYSDADQRKHQSSASLAFVRGIHRWPLNYPHKWPVTRTMLPFDDVIMDTGMVIERICIHYLIIIIKSEVWVICHYLGLGHETMMRCMSFCVLRELVTRRRTQTRYQQLCYWPNRSIAWLLIPCLCASPGNQLPNRSIAWLLIPCLCASPGNQLLNRSIAWLLIPCLCASPGNQLPNRSIAWLLIPCLCAPPGNQLPNRSIAWLLIPCLCASPGHQLP